MPRPSSPHPTSHSVRARRLSAAWVLPMSGPPIREGSVLIGSDGRILEVGPQDRVGHPADADVSEWPDAVLLPGLVNTHTHLELTGFAGLAEEADFAAWIRRIRALKAERTPAEFLAAARAGLADCHAAGVTTVADTGDTGAVIEAMVEAGGSGIAYHEVFGPHPDQLEESMAGLRQRIGELRRLDVGRVRLGVSPHAPYTVSGPLYAAVAEFAKREGLPMAVHLAESEAESDLLGGASGAFAEAWRLRGIPLPALPGRSPVTWLDAHGVLGEHTLAIHVVRADAGRRGTAAGERHRRGALPPLQPAARARRGPPRRLPRGRPPRGRGDRLRGERGPPRPARRGAGRPAPWRASRRSGPWRWPPGARPRALGLQDEVGMLQRGLWGDVAVVEVSGAGTARRRRSRRYWPPSPQMWRRRSSVGAPCIGGETGRCTVPCSLQRRPLRFWQPTHAGITACAAWH